jgi:hypothetical protein
MSFLAFYAYKKSSGSALTIASSGLLKNAGSDNDTWTSDTGVTVAPGQLLVVGCLPRKTSNSDTNVVVTAATYNGANLDVELNARQSGSTKRCVLFLSNKTLLTTGTNANVVVNLSGSAVQFEAFQMFYWVLQNQNATPIPGAEWGVANASTDDTLVLTRTGALAGSILLGMWAVDDGDEVVTVTDGIEDSNVSTGSGTQDFKGVFAHKSVASAGDTTMTATWSDQPAIGAILEVAAA